MHNARIICNAGISKCQLISLLTSDIDYDSNEIIAIYRKRCEVHLSLSI